MYELLSSIQPHGFNPLGAACELSILFVCIPKPSVLFFIILKSFINCGQCELTKVVFTPKSKWFFHHESVLLFATPWSVQSMEFSRPEYWSGYPFPSLGDLPNPGIEPRSPTLWVDSFPSWNQHYLVLNFRSIFYVFLFFFKLKSLSLEWFSQNEESLFLRYDDSLCQETAIVHGPQEQDFDFQFCLPRFR